MRASGRAGLDGTRRSGNHDLETHGDGPLVQNQNHGFRRTVDRLAVRHLLGWLLRLSAWEAGGPTVKVLFSGSDRRLRHVLGAFEGWGPWGARAVINAGHRPLR